MHRNGIRFSPYLLVLTALLLSSCTAETSSDPLSRIEPVTLEEPDLLIDFDPDGPTSAGAVELLDGGTIAVLDPRASQVLIFGRDGALQARFGEEGSGPGAFERAWFMQAASGTLHVVDVEQRRISQFDPTGTLLQDYTYEQASFSPEVTVLDASRYVVGANGENGYLLRLTDAETDSVHFFGEAAGPHLPSPIQLEEQRRALERGEIPGYVKNRVTTQASGDHLYVFLDAYSRLQQYTLDGELRWETNLELPQNETIFREAVERAAETGPHAVPHYQFITSIEAAGDTIYLLWNRAEGHSRQLVKVSTAGAVEALFNLPEGEEAWYYDFAVDPESGELFLAAPEMGQIYRASLPD